MGDGVGEQDRGLSPLRVFRFFDPAEPGFVGRMARLVIGAAATLAVGLIAAGLIVAPTERGRYTIAYWLSVSHRHEPALRWTSALVDDFPGTKWEYYRLKAFNLRHLDLVDESLAVYDDAIQALPDYWWPHSHRCFYGAALGDPETVLDSCDRSIELGPGNPEVAYSRRAVARGLTGDLEGAGDDLRVSIEAYRKSGDYTWELDVREAWLQTIEDGGDPFTTDAMAEEMSHY
jgi:tetratricopeptide (TPR) repeat protein